MARRAVWLCVGSFKWLLLLLVVVVVVVVLRHGCACLRGCGKPVNRYTSLLPLRFHCGDYCVFTPLAVLAAAATK
jgi:hypothetical protein